MMMSNQRRTLQGTIPVILALLISAGCGDQSEPGDEAAASPDGEGQPATERVSEATPSQPPPQFAPVVLGGDSTASSGDAMTPEAVSSAQNRQELLSAMMPLQVMLGSWRGITRQQVGDFKGVDEPQWVWDFQTDRDQPQMVMTSEGGEYFRELRLTYLTDRDTFRMTSMGPEDETRVFEGSFSVEPAEVQGDDDRSHITYKLMLTQLDSDETPEQWQVVFNQQENNRYLLELYRKRGETFRRMDTVSTQRQGTSIAASDEDYGTRKCVISGGLGTMQVSYAGRTFWVCCTGCKAAFEEDPESWIAEFDAASE